MDGSNQRRALEAQYARIVRAHAEHEVVDAAERIVCDAWLERLETLGTNAAQLMASSRAAHQAATAHVREARDAALASPLQPGSDAADAAADAADAAASTALTSGLLTRALHLLEQVELSYSENKKLCGEVLVFAQQQLDALARARCAREVRRRVNAACVEAARHAAMGVLPPSPDQ
ncbi:hypothetical protein KDL01_28090 [Actinospica durhamensis]|uniref:Uncharacterized protein n=1 Tax=Actinospica durhamensis TaxID=1508375 RepID=A0A941ERN4_9ACTN|nr:hypothetical protein [Actinospica durhamensis]MBR7837170.1 hypothetical protein [Actinospica durhamensis]